MNATNLRKSKLQNQSTSNPTNSQHQSRRNNLPSPPNPQKINKQKEKKRKENRSIGRGNLTRFLFSGRNSGSVLGLAAAGALTRFPLVEALDSLGSSSGDLLPRSSSLFAASAAAFLFLPFGVALGLLISDQTNYGSD